MKIENICNNNILVSLLLLCFIITILIWSSKRYYNEHRREEFCSFFWALQISLCCAIMHHHYQISTINNVENLSTKFWISCGIILALLIMKQGLYKWVHYIFFSEEENTLWKTKFNKIFSTESTALLTTCFIVIYQPISANIALYIALFVVGMTKIVVFVVDRKMFFQKIYTFLHFFVYFCTLEIAPIILGWVILGKIYD